MRTILIALLFCVMYSQTYSQDYYNIIEPGKIGIDAGFSFDHLNKSVKVNKLTTATVEYKDNMLPEVTLGYGITKGVDAGIDLAYRTINASALLKIAKQKGIGIKGKGEGIDALTLYGKFGLSRERGSMPAVTLETDFIIPGTGAKYFKADNPGFIPTLSVFKTLGSSFDIVTSLSTGWDGVTAYPVGEFNLSPELYLSDEFDIYAEYDGTYTKYAGPDNKADVGFYWTASDNFALEGYIGSVFGQYFGDRILGGLTFHFTF